jgi:cytochrome o ubiquinol oxidase operon protein cyoD
MSQAIDFNEAWRGSIRSYLTGYVLSLVLTSTAFWLVHKHLAANHVSPTDTFMFWALSALALTQLFVQLVFFLHLDRESKPRWNNVVLGFAAIVVIILVGGSIWIMTNLNYHHNGFGHTHAGHTQASPQQTTQYIIKDEGVQP